MVKDEEDEDEEWEVIEEEEGVLDSLADAVGSIIPGVPKQEKKKIIRRR